MSEAEPDRSPEPPTAAQPSRLRWRVVPRGLAWAAIVVLLVFVGSRGTTLWREWLTLRAEMNGVRTSTIVGYPGITPRFSQARWPTDWQREEGGRLLLWGGWHDGGHTWFRLDRGDIDRARMSEPMGRDVIRAIDYPLIEQGGGRYWSLIPDDATVVGTRHGGVDTAYPVLVLSKVLVVNDTVGEQPLLVLSTPVGSQETLTTMYDPIIEGRRLTMGLSGYFHDRRPVLYDRATESLWVADLDGLQAISGPYKGRGLSLIGRPTAVPWSDWRSRHPSSRLVIGADRSQARPES